MILSLYAVIIMGNDSVRANGNGVTIFAELYKNVLAIDNHIH